MAPAAPLPFAYLVFLTLTRCITFVKVTCADSRPMWLSLAPPAGPAGQWERGSSGSWHPLSGRCVRTHPDKGGASGQAVGACMPGGAMCWPVSATFRLYSRDGPHIPAPGSILVWLAAPCCGVHSGLLKGMAHPKGTMVQTVPCPMSPLHSPALGPGVAGWRVQGAQCGVCSPVKYSWCSRAAGCLTSVRLGCAGCVGGPLRTPRYTSWGFCHNRHLTGMHCS